MNDPALEYRLQQIEAAIVHLAARLGSTQDLYDDLKVLSDDADPLPVKAHSLLRALHGSLKSG